MLCLLIAALVLAAGAPAAAAAPAAFTPIELVGSLPHPHPITLAELQAMHVVETRWTVHDKEHSVRGVALDEVLAAAGFSPGPMGRDASGRETAKREKRAGWKQIVIANADDGFQSVFSAAELFAEMGSTRALIVWEIDGAPPREGGFRLVVLTDKEPSRSIYSLHVLEVIDARDLHAVPAVSR